MDRRYAGGDVVMTRPVSLRSRVMGNYQARFWRAVGGMTHLLTLLLNSARNIGLRYLSKHYEKPTLVTERFDKIVTQPYKNT